MSLRLSSLLLVVLVYAAQPTSATRYRPPVLPTPLPYQAHGVNDFDAWYQYLIKGTRYIKIDVALMSLHACTKLSTWSGDPSTCLGTKPFCCVGFRGDTSSAPDVTMPFNTSADFLRLLTDDEYAPFFRAEDPLVVQLYYSKGYHDGQPEQQLLVDFMVTLNQTVANYSLNVVFMELSWVWKADYACYPSPGPDCTPELALLTTLPTSRFVGYGYPGRLNDTDPRDRLRVFNIGQSHFTNVCTTGFPQWQRADSFAYTWVEPSTQPDIVNLLRNQTECPHFPPSHRDVGAQRVTCNQGPEMFTVFGSSLIRRGDNSLFAAGGVGATSPRMVTVPAAAKSAWSAFMLLSYIDATGGILLASIGIVPDKSPAQHDALLSSLPLSSVGPPVFLTASCQTELQCAVLAADAAGQISVSYLDASSGMLKADYTARLMLADHISPSSPPLLAGTYVHDAEHLLVLYSTDSCALTAELIALTPAAATGAAGSRASVSACIQNQFVPSNASVAVTKDEGLVIYSGRDPVTNLSAIYAAYLQVAAEAGQLYVENGTTAGEPLHRLDFGREPSVSLLSYRGETFAMETHTDGMCQFGYAINNNDFNHCLFTDAEVMGLASVPNLLNYNYASLADFRAAINDRELAGTCSHRLIGGKYDTGVTTAVSLFAFNSTLEFYEVHNADVPPAPLTKTICGNPVRQHGLVFDKFPLPQPL